MEGSVPVCSVIKRKQRRWPKASIALMELVEKYADANLFRELGQWTLRRLMQAEVEAKAGAAGRHERIDNRVNHRNGHHARNLETRMGTVNLQIPKLRSGSYLPSSLTRETVREYVDPDETEAGRISFGRSL